MDNITDQEWATFNAALRKIDPREQLASPVLTDKQWVVYGELQRRLRHPEHFQFGLFAGASISAFFNPEDRFLKHSFKQERFEVSVLFAITDRELAGLPKFFVLDDVCDSPIFHHLKAPFLYWDENCDPKEFANKVLQRLVNTTPTNLTAQREVVNQSELYVGRQLILHRITDHQYGSLAGNDEIDSAQLEKLRYRFPKMLREVALTRLAPIRMPPIDVDLQIKLSRLNVDILVHSVVPNIPILAIEVDGPRHLEQYKIGNDLIKERILKMFGVPLLRVLPTERTKFFPNKLYSDENELFVSMFIFLAKQIALHSKQFQSTYVEWVKLDNALEKFKDDSAKSYFGKPYDLLAEQQRSQVIDDVVFSQPFENMQMFDRDDAEFEERFEIRESEWTPHQSSYCSRPSISKGPDEVWTFKATFKHKGVIEVIPSPRIKLLAAFLSDELVEQIIKASFFTFVKSWVENRLRN